MGALDSTAFKAVFRDLSNILIQKGAAWFNNKYITMASNVILGAGLTNGTHFVYLNLNNTTGSGFEFTATLSSLETDTLTPIQVDRRVKIPLAKYEVVGGQIQRSSFLTFKSKFWQFRDPPFEAEETFSLTSSASSFIVTNFSFIDDDFLDVDVNGINVYETDDYTKDGVTNTINFISLVLTGAKIKVRKV